MLFPIPQGNVWVEESRIIKYVVMHTRPKYTDHGNIEKSAVLDNKNGKCFRLSLLRLVFCQLILCLHISSGIEFASGSRGSHQTLIHVDGNHTSTRVEKAKEDIFLDCISESRWLHYILSDLTAMSFRSAFLSLSSVSFHFVCSGVLCLVESISCMRTHGIN